MKAGDVPLKTLVGSFLKACQDQQVEVVVWTAPRTGDKQQLSSNTGETGIGKLRALLSVKAGGVDAAARAIHGFRLVEEGKAVDPSMDFCPYLMCAGHVDDESRARGRGYGAEPWDKLPEVLKEAHRALARVVLGAAMTSTPTKKLTSV